MSMKLWGGLGKAGGKSVLIPGESNGLTDEAYHGASCTSKGCEGGFPSLDEARPVHCPFGTVSDPFQAIRQTWMPSMRKP